eukprot:IDg3732t1
MTSAAHEVHGVAQAQDNANLGVQSNCTLPLSSDNDNYATLESRNDSTVIFGSAIAPELDGPMCTPLQDKETIGPVEIPWCGDYELELCVHMPPTSRNRFCTFP